MKWIHDKNEVPDKPHYAIIEFSSYYVEGDERSRTNPGHGYSGHSEYKCEYILFESEEEWKKEIERRELSKFTGAGRNYIAVRATPASIETKINVNII
jgi:hypothetical protein